MNEKLAYYRSLNNEELINLPREEYDEYMLLLCEASNNSFRKYMDGLKEKDGSVDLHRSECNICIDVSDENHIYHCAYKMNFLELIEEYLVSKAIETYLLSGSSVVAGAFFTVYICSVNSILEQVICERVSYHYSKQFNGDR